MNKDFFLPFLNLKIKFKKQKTLKIALYYPSNFELNDIKLMEFNIISSQDTLLPVIEKNNIMNFFSWKKKRMFYLLMNLYP